MKKLLLVLILLVTAGSVFAADLKVTGDAFVRGTTWGDDSSGSTEKYSYFDYDFNLNLALIANENATVNMKLTYDKNVKDTNTVVADGSASAADVGLAVERAFINYKFHPALQLNTGLMGGGQWASDFANKEINVPRVQLIGALSADMVFIATYEKRSEIGAQVTTTDSEKDDSNVYYLASRMKFGPLTVLPLFYYGTTGINNSGSVTAQLVGGGVPLAVANTYIGTYDASLMGAQLGLEGDFGMFGFVFDSRYDKKDMDGFDKDYAALDAAVGGSLANLGYDKKDTTTYGAMLDVFVKIAPVKAGFIYAYASADVKDGYFDMGADFNPLIIANDEVADEFVGRSIYILYADVTPIEKLTVTAKVGYGAGNDSADESTFTEYNLSAAWAFDANTTYSLGYGYASFDSGVSGADPVVATKLYHKFAVKF
jgi:hypothetical protein